MIAGTFDLDGFAVEKKSLVGIPSKLAYAEADALRIACFAAGLDRDNRRIHIRRFRRPERGIRHVRARRESCGSVRGDRLRRGLRRRHDFSRGIEYLPAHAATFRLPAVVLHVRSKAQRRGATFDRSANVTVPMSQMERIGLRQPHVPINPCTFIEPAIAKAGVHAHDQLILTAIVKEIRDVEAEGRIAVVVAAHERSVQKYERAAERAIEFKYG